jgi:hypothetical protein
MFKCNALIAGRFNQSIFVGSGDIRVQLPEESKRFDSVDFDWKEMMKDAPYLMQ